MDNVAFAGTTAPVNENAPEFNYDSVFLQQNENIDTTQVIHSASATDADGDDVTYSLGGDDADAFDIDEEGGVTFAESPDYESGVTSYDFTITASDGSLTDEQAVTVQINNVVEQYTLDPADLASGGEFAGEAMDDRMDGRGSTSALELSGGAGTDVLYGGDAGDVLDGGDGNDQLSGGGGDDVLIAGAGVDRIDGGDGIDTVMLGQSLDLTGGGLVSGDEMVSINLAREWQYSGDGWNQIVNVENVVTGGGADIIKGNDIGNVVESGAGNDWVYANGGDDVLIGGEGIDRLFGGDGNDTVLYETDEDLVIDLNSEWQLGNGETSEGIDKLIDIENVTTGSGEDVLIGTDGSNILTGGDGDDTLTGGDGADVFRFYSSEGPSTDVITDFTVGEDSIEFIDDTTGAVAQAQITTDADGSMVTWDDLTIMLDVNVNYDDINPITD
jgi:Ca2+-binding RTX toxin-like protein